MKRLLIFFTIIFLFAGSLFAQWEAFPEYSDFLYDEYGVDMQVYFSEEYGYIGFVDEYPMSRFDVTRTVSFILSSFEFFIDFDAEMLDEYGIEGIAIYLTVEPDFSSKSSEVMDLEIDFSEDWLYRYYTTSSRRQSDMLIDELNYYF